ncbi:hypothetical protein [Azospirillum sp. A39]|uniref:hypothetical protein n=1 Tax=Azospirillum sp. A39 TaxID=3462279 RepID=UPI0040467910
MQGATRTPAYAGRGGSRSIIALAGTLITVFIVNSLIGLFAIQYAGDADVRDQTTLARLSHALDTAREAQVAFKIQVQEWKNVLLRGGDAKDYDRYLASFEEQERRVRDRLEALAAAAGDLGLDAAAMQAALADHATLAARYRDGLALFDRTHPASVAVVDRAVRGIDRPMDEAIDALAEAARARAAAIRADLEAARAERYRTLRTVAIASMLVGIALVGAILVRTSVRRA